MKRFIDNFWWFVAAIELSRPLLNKTTCSVFFLKAANHSRDVTQMQNIQIQGPWHVLSSSSVRPSIRKAFLSLRTFKISFRNKILSKYIPYLENLQQVFYSLNTTKLEQLQKHLVLFQSQNSPKNRVEILQSYCLLLISQTGLEDFREKSPKNRRSRPDLSR